MIKNIPSVNRSSRQSSVGCGNTNVVRRMDDSQAHEETIPEGITTSFAKIRLGLSVSK